MAMGESQSPVSGKSLHERLMQRKQALWNIRQDREVEYQEVVDYLIPRLGRFYRHEARQTSQRYSRYKAILDSAGGRAHRICSAGLMAGMSSPARPWFRLTTTDPDLAEFGPVKEWLGDVQTLMRDVFSRSNSYRALHAIYDELGAFGTGVSIILPDFEDVIRHYTMTAGEYAIASDNRGVINTLYRELNMTAEQMMAEFGRDHVSEKVKTAYDNGNYDTLFPVLHAIEPRRERDLRRRNAEHKRFGSYYLEPGTDNRMLLRESGFDRFPALPPRWLVAPSDDYGVAPAIEAIGDIKQLQHEQLRKAQGIDYMTEPPIQVPGAMRVSQIDRLPGGVSYVDSAGAQAGVRTLFEVKLDLSHLLADIQDVRERINSAFYADLFMMIAQDDRSGVTAREIAERHEEKLLMLGPVLERLHNELLAPKIDLTFDRILSTPGMLPPPPEELQGQDLNVEFVSTLAQAQRAVGVGAVDRLIATIGAIAMMKPEVLDKLDADQTIDKYSDMLGVDPSIIVADEKVAIVRKERQQQQAAVTAAAAVPPAAAAAKDLAAADTSGRNALTDAVNFFQGYTGNAA